MCNCCCRFHIVFLHGGLSSPCFRSISLYLPPACVYVCRVRVRRRVDAWRHQWLPAENAELCRWNPFLSLSPFLSLPILSLFARLQSLAADRRTRMRCLAMHPLAAISILRSAFRLGQRIINCYMAYKMALLFQVVFIWLVQGRTSCLSFFAWKGTCIGFGRERWT